MIRSLVSIVWFGLAVAIGAAAPLTASAQQDEFKQVQLTDANVQNYIKAHSELQGLLEQIEKAGDKPEPKLIAQLETLAKKHGFSSFDDLDAVSSTIAFIVTGFDLESGEFIEPRKAMQEEIAMLKKDKALKEDERNEIIKELEEAVKTTPDVAHKENIALVKKYLRDLEKIME